MRYHDAIKCRDLSTKEARGASLTQSVMWHAGVGRDMAGNDFSKEALSNE
jgi:hypothetical protein